MELFSYGSYYIEPLLGSRYCCSAAPTGLSQIEQAQLKTTKIIDGVVFVANTLEFFTLSPPLALDRIWVERRAEERFKGLERWRNELPHVLEIKLFAVRGYPLSVLFAYDGFEGINFHKVIEKVNAAKEDAMNSLPDSCSSKTQFKNSTDKVARFVEENDFRIFQKIFKTYLDKHLDVLRPNTRTCFILYKFGQCARWELFHTEFNWVMQNNLTHLIIHYARDFELENHILWYMPSAIRKTLGRQPESIYYVGLQPGLGNVRHKPKQNHIGEIGITHVTWYTRIWNEIHRDKSKFFSRDRRLTTELEKIVWECFSAKQVRTIIPTDLRQNIPNVVRNSSILMESYPARCEAVVLFTGKLLKSKSLQELLCECVNIADREMEKLEFYSPVLLKAQRTRFYQEKISRWFRLFAGTIDRVVGFISRIKVVRDKLDEGKRTEQTLDCFQSLVDLFAVDLILTLCYTGNFVVKKSVYHALGLDTNYFLQNVKLTFCEFYQLKQRFIEGRECLEVTISKKVFAEYFNKMFWADIPSSYDAVFTKTNELANLATQRQIPVKDKLDKKRKLVQQVCSATTNVLLGMCYQFSDLPYCENRNMNMLTKFITEGSFKGAHVFTSTEFVLLLQGIPSPNRSGLDDRFYFLRRVLSKLVEPVSKNSLWELLDEALIDKIIGEDRPLVFAKSLQKHSSPNMIVTPGFRHQNLTSHKLAFNRTWTYAAHLYNGEPIPELTKPLRVYECFEKLSARKKKRFESGTFVDALVFASNFQVEKPSRPAPKNFIDLPEDARTSRPRGRHSRFVKRKSLSAEEIEKEQEEFALATSFVEKAGALQMGPATVVHILRSGLPVGLSELACNYTGNCWMSGLTVNACMEIIGSQSDQIFFENNIILPYDSLMCLGTGMWSERMERLEAVNANTQKVFHIVYLVDHFVLITIDVVTLGSIISLKMFTYNPLEKNPFYQDLTRTAEIKLLSMVKTRLLQCHEGSEIKIFESSNCKDMQQDDDVNCGPACLRFLECILHSKHEDPARFDNTLKNMPFQDYKWRLTLDLLKQSDNGRKICEHFNMDRDYIVDFLRTHSD
ncbi:unnamed protein product [Allacma fusca]|uniref:Uncharacterized protein n=1 Tax=Allacma fusca TaxID=39272 RepID=A0A8J2J8Z7_9HEXA|nr:unnamed protein product [Allacma fusca]